MSISRGYLVAFRSSVRACLAEMQAAVDSGKISGSDLSVSFTELSCIQAVLDRIDASGESACFPSVP